MADITSLKIQGKVLSPDSPDYQKALHRNSDLSILDAAYVVQPEAYADIPPVLAYAASHGLEVAVTGGGCHSSTWASSKGGVVIDLGHLNKVTLSADKGVVTIQGGARWGDVYEVGGKEQREIPGAPLWFVGVGGSLLSGASGYLSGRYGLGIDNLVAATVVLADGRIVRTSAEEEPDLFWAIRGGGNQFGIVVEFELQTYPSPGPATTGTLIFPGTEFDGVLKAIQEFHEQASVDEKLTVVWACPGPHFKPTIIVAPWISATAERSPDKILEPLRTNATPVVDKITTAPDQSTLSHASDAAQARSPRRLQIRGGAFSKFYTDVLVGSWERWVKFTEDNEDARASTLIWDVRNPGAITKVGATDTAYPIRKPHCFVAIQGRNTRPETDEVTSAWLKSIAEFIREANTANSGEDLGVILGMATGDELPEAVFGPNLPRLRKLKAKYDPKNVWSKGFTIEPDFS
ncbi:FAD-binding domain-containing protein [Dentipellis sp. KUC8613]|nr:FAD-binding domain-containing protein [Dentipellis sp. KUC8613]